MSSSPSFSHILRSDNLTVTNIKLRITINRLRLIEMTGILYRYYDEE